MSRELIYVGDPLCSWCWGFAPVVGVLEQRFGLPVRVVVGGLRPGPAARPLDEELAEVLGHHWEQVEARTGQPFNRGALDWRGWLYDTEPPCRAVVTMRELAPAQTLPFFTRLQEAFYVENRDVTSPDIYPGLLEGFPVETEEFLERWASPDMRRRTWEDFRQARSMGVSGFPTLLLREDDRLRTVTRGYVPLEVLEPVLEGVQADAS